MICLPPLLSTNRIYASMADLSFVYLSIGVGINSRPISVTSNTGKFLKTDLTASVTIAGSCFNSNIRGWNRLNAIGWLESRLLNSLNPSIVSFSLLLATLTLAYSKVSFIRKFFPDTSPPLIMFPYFRLEALVGPNPSSSPISTLYMDWRSLAFLMKALSLPHWFPYILSIIFLFICVVLINHIPFKEVMI